MFSRCATVYLVRLPATLELPLLHINNQDSTVCLRCTSYHVSYEVTMTWRVQNAESTIRSGKISGCDLDCNTSLLLFLSFVHKICKLEACLVVDLCLSFVLFQLVLRKSAIFKQNLTRKCAFTTINVTNDN